MTDERFIVLRFTETEDLKNFYELLEDSGYIQKLSNVTSDEDKVDKEKKESNDTQWTEWGAGYDDENSTGVNNMRVGGP